MAAATRLPATYPAKVPSATPPKGNREGAERGQTDAPQAPTTRTLLCHAQLGAVATSRIAVTDGDARRPRITPRVNSEDLVGLPGQGRANFWPVSVTYLS